MWCSTFVAICFLIMKCNIKDPAPTPHNVRTMGKKTNITSATLPVMTWFKRVPLSDQTSHHVRCGTSPQDGDALGQILLLTGQFGGDQKRSVFNPCHPPISHPSFLFSDLIQQIITFFLSLCYGKRGQIFPPHDRQREHRALAGGHTQALLSHLSAVTP